MRSAVVVVLLGARRIDFRVVVSSEGRETSGTTEWCSGRHSAGMSCHLFRAVLMR